MNAEFRARAVKGILRQISLDDDSSVSDDIRLFVNKKFDIIKETHEVRNELDSSWPSPAEVEKIVSYSSTQFIFASVAMNFISSPKKNPAAQLKIILGLRSDKNTKPFAQLDALYMHIFSGVEEPELTFLVLACALFPISESVDISDCASMLSMGDADVYIALAPLSSVLSYTDGKIRFLHVTLPDFLRDRYRSRKFFMDRATWCSKIASRSMKRKPDAQDLGESCILILVRLHNYCL